MLIKPTGARVRVRMLSNEIVTKGGIVIPGTELANVAGQGGDKEPRQFLQLIEILDVGDGKLDPSTNRFVGSRYKPGQTCLMRVGISAQVHIDFIPGRPMEAIVLEDTIVGIVQIGEEQRASA